MITKQKFKKKENAKKYNEKNKEFEEKRRP
jgi:hypothetical protein